jgi:hypothetical protein
MPLIPSNFATNSLTGTTKVSGGFANVTLIVSNYAFEDRTKTFTLKLRRDAVDGVVIAQSNLVTLTDFSEIISLTANTSTVAEGNLVSLALVTANVVNGTNVFFSVLPATANITTSDFFGSNTGVVTINNNQGTIVLQANADYSLMDETGETFRVQLRTVDTTGNVVFVSSNIAITDFYKRINVFRFEESSRAIVEGTSVTFTIFAHNIATGTLLHFYTSGNAGISGSNTGSIAMNSVSNTITITTSATVPTAEYRSFNLVLSETSLGTPIATSNAITVADSSLAYLNATGGTISSIDGFRIHTFTSSNTFTVSNFATAAFNTANVLVIAGGGGGGARQPENRYGGGGGGGGFVSQTSIPFSATGTYNITIGAGGAGVLWSPAPSYVGTNGGNSSITAGSNFSNVIAVGGGGGGDWIGASPGRNGGSGGGGYTAGSGFGFPGPTQQGFPGGSFLAHPQGILWQAGGGAGGVGLEGAPPGYGVPAPATPSFAPFRRTAFGGPGANSTITGSNVTYAGGGGGGNDNGSVNDGGTGGGGYSSYNSVGPSAPSFPAAGVNGTVNRGGGGGAGFAANAGTGGSGIVIIRYPWVPPAGYVSATANSSGIFHGDNAFFVVNTTFANNSILYYDTLGNVNSSSFVGGNTGSFTVTGNATVVRLQTVRNIPQDQERMFALRIREDSATTGNIRLVSSNVFVYDSNVGLYLAATGGNVFTSGGYRTHIFTTSNNFAVTNAGRTDGSIEYFMVAGGGAGGAEAGGGGGAGGVLFGSASVVANTYVVTVGAGGTGVAASTAGVSGSNTSVIGATTIGPGVVAVGGGGGGGRPGANTTGRNGGSGGGGATTGPGARSPGGAAYGSGTLGSTLQGSAGGESSSDPAGGGGGGGAGGAGQPTQNVGVGTAGTGVGSPLSASIPGFFGTPGASPTLRYFAGGGGGGGFPGRGPGPGSVGGGGAGGFFTPGQPANSIGVTGNVNTGGGGGGGAQSIPDPVNYSGSGGSGIVVIRYPFVQTAEFTSVTANSTVASEGSNVFFVVRTNFANANTLFYDTIGNVTSASFVGGNTGSFVVTGNETVVRLETTATVPANETRSFALRIRQDAANGSIRLTSQNVTINDTGISFLIGTGGTQTTSGGYRIHTFTTSNTFTVTSIGNVVGVDYLVVAGGGGGATLRGPGSGGGGGGGAGGMLTGTFNLVAANAGASYTVTVGAGGAGGTVNAPTMPLMAGASGNSSSIFGIVATGGGGGGIAPDGYPGIANPGLPGGSGGGSGGGLGVPTVPAVGGSGAPGQGNPGGASISDYAGGGGGAAQAGSAATVTPTSGSGGKGGDGAPSLISGANVIYAGGGGGGAGVPPAVPGAVGGLGGEGGGGRGASPGGPTGSAGTVNLGGGGGGQGFHAGPYAGRPGGSGIVIIRYPIT